jgi:mannose-6-phosphate isomerase
MYSLENQVKEYAWGSHTAIAELLGQPSPSPRPQAELWLGAHPQAPSRVHRNGAWQSLLEVIAAAPETVLGAGVVSKFGAALPFLFKVLAAQTPLSLQAHPNSEQARSGFDAEELAKVPLEAPHRNYKDRNHKPELLCALGPFELLSGFRKASDTVRLFESLGIEALKQPIAALSRSPDEEGLKILFRWLMGATGPVREEVVRATLSACKSRVDDGGEFARECQWSLRLGAWYPGDIGVTAALLLTLVTLEKGQAVYLPAGHLHSYLKGTGIEIMANSDNVIRGGLTPKYVDVAELLRVLTFANGPVTVISPRGDGGPERVYATPAQEFRLSTIELRHPQIFRAADRTGPEILLCTDGSLLLSCEGPPRALPKGGSVFVPASVGAYEIGGTGTAFRATVPAS